MRHSPGIVIDRGYIYIRIWPQGRKGRMFRQHFGPANKENLARAEYKLREYRNQIANGKFNVPDEQMRITVNQACDIYWRLHAQSRRSRAAYRTSLNHIRDAWGERYFDEVTYEDVEKYRHEAERVRSPSTVNREHTIITHLPRIFRRWIATKQTCLVKLPDNPGSLVSKAPETENRRTRVLSMEEYERLQAHAGKSLRLICEMAVTTLLRKRDLELLSRDNYHSVTRTLSGIQTKTIVPGRSKGRSYCIPIESSDLEKQIMTTEGRVLDFTNFRRKLEAAVKAANVKDFVFKDLRRTGATWLYKKGMDIKTISLLLGHASTQMTETYLGIVDGHTREAAKILQNTFRSVVNSVVKPIDFQSVRKSKQVYF
jgi:integrase